MYDFLVVGHGLAGSVLALTLKKRGHSVLVIDDPSLSSCSRIAAGIINPIAIRRMSLSWKADEFIPFLQGFYSDAERYLDAAFFKRLRMLKPYGSEEDQEQWQLRKSDASLASFLGKNDVFCEAPVINPYGCLEILESGWLNTLAFLNASRNFLKENYLQESFEHTELKLNGSSISYRNINAQRIIFCEGFRAMEKNPWFGKIPFALTKGQVLDVEVEGFNSESILNRGVFLLPLGEGHYRLGATYSWRDHTETVMPEATEELLKKAGGYISSGITALSAKAGIRPTIRDRRPVIGAHPEHSEMFIFNGLGSKAVMFAPLLATQLADHMANGTPLYPEVSCSRFIHA